MKERPISFSTDMVKAILSGIKTQTRRVIKPQPIRINDDFDGTWEWRAKGQYYDDLTLYSMLKGHCPYGQIGDRLWVREAFRARLSEYRACGKTGTAQKIEADGRYSHSKFIASFIGFAPVDNPRIAVLVCVDEPRPIYYGGSVAAPAFKRITEGVLRYLKVASDRKLIAKR